MSKRWLVVVPVLLLAACRGNLVATARLSGPGTAEARFNSTKNVELWSDFDGSWEGNASTKYSAPPISYDIDVMQEGNLVGQVACTTKGVSHRVCGGFSKVGSSFNGDCEFKMNCALPAVRSGEVLLKVTGKIADPERVKSVKNMSLNIRTP